MINQLWHLHRAQNQQILKDNYTIMDIANEKMRFFWKDFIKEQVKLDKCRFSTSKEFQV